MRLYELYYCLQRFRQCLYSSSIEIQNSPKLTFVLFNETNSMFTDRNHYFI